MFSSTFLSLLLIAASATNASPIHRGLGSPILSFASKIGALGNKTLVEIDRARATALIHNAQMNTSGKRSEYVPVSNTGVRFTTKVDVGSPPTQYTLLIDTGSSNTWIGANNSGSYTPTSTSTRTGDYIAMSYGSGQFSGDEFEDLVSLGPGLAIKNQSIGVSTESEGFSGIDGILGLGPVDLTKGSLSNPNKTVPTVLDNLYKQKLIPSETLGIYFAPSHGLPKGELSFGAVDTTKTVGPVKYVPITKTGISQKYWGIDQSISYGSEAILSQGSGFVDTGTTLILLETTAFNKYKSATGGKIDQHTGLLKITPAQFSALRPLNFNVGGNTYSLIPDAQIWPRALNSEIGGDKDSIYLVVSDLGLGRGFDFVNGFAFLQRFYSVYDTTHRRVGFAKTLATTAKSNY